MYTPHTVTVYNTEIVRDPETYKDVVINHITVLQGVLLDASKGENVKATGMESADAVNLYVPFTVQAVDGVTGEAKQYAGAKAFWQAEDKSGLWTFSTGGNTFFVKGIVTEPDKSFMTIDLKYDDVYLVTKVDAKDFGSPDMQHWEVGGE